MTSFSPVLYKRMSNLFANVLLYEQIQALVWSTKATSVSATPTASTVQQEFWQNKPRIRYSGADPQLVQRKLGCASLDLSQLTLAGGLDMQATKTSPLLKSEEIVTAAVHPSESFRRLHQGLRKMFRVGNTL